MEHARQCKMAEPSSSVVKRLGIVATREQHLKQDHDTPTFVQLHPFGVWRDVLCGATKGLLVARPSTKDGQFDDSLSMQTLNEGDFQPLCAEIDPWLSRSTASRSRSSKNRARPCLQYVSEIMTALCT